MADDRGTCFQILWSRSADNECEFRDRFLIWRNHCLHLARRRFRPPRTRFPRRRTKIECTSPRGTEYNSSKTSCAPKFRTIPAGYTHYLHTHTHTETRAYKVRYEYYIFRTKTHVFLCRRRTREGERSSLPAEYDSKFRVGAAKPFVQDAFFPERRPSVRQNTYVQNEPVHTDVGFERYDYVSRPGSTRRYGKDNNISIGTTAVCKRL